MYIWEGGGMSNYLCNLAVLRKIQIARDNSEPPEYWDNPMDDDGEDDDGD